MRVTGTMLYRHARSPFSVWCDRHAPAEARDPPSPFLDHLLRAGNEHERRVVARQHPGALSLASEGEEEGFALALDAMRRGVAAIHGAPLLHGDLAGRADVLVRDESAPSQFGPWHYVVKEVKLARQLGPEHRVQGDLYTRILGALQGFTPPAWRLVDGAGEERAVPHDAGALDAAIDALRRTFAGERPPAVLGTGLHPWERYTDRCAIEADDVSLVDGVGMSLRGSLVAAGYATVRALAAAREEELRAIRGVGPTRSRRLPLAAGALARGEHVRLGRVELPACATEVFLDLEGIGDQPGTSDLAPMDYLIGALVRRDGREEYRAFVAPTPEGEREMLAAFLDWLATLEDPRLFHWHHYERTHLKRMSERHGLLDAYERLVAPRLVDLHPIATRAFVFPTYGTSIKRIAPWLGFSWRHKDVNAMESIALYLQYAQDPAAHADKLRKVLDYNEDDCVATRVVKDWLAQQGA